MDDGLILRFAVALAIGFVVGVERGWRERDAPAGSRTAGVRTYSLVGLLGAVSAALAQALASPLVLAAGALAFTAVFAWFKSREAEHDNEFSVTGVIAALLVFGLGGLCVVGDYRAAGAGGVAAAGLLASRDGLHSLLQRMTWAELRSALLLLAMTVVVLPLLPDRTIDPFGGVNPREIWLFTILTAGISFLGYVAVKLAGPTRGILIGALAGALASSTAVTVAFARRASAGEPAGPLAGGAALAGLVSPLRVCVIVGVVSPPVLSALAPPAVAGALAFGAAGLLLLRRSSIGSGATVVGNPFDLVPLLLFAAALALVGLASGWLTERVGSGGLFATSGVFGLLDVDVAALSAARLVGDRVSATDAALAVLLALAVNAGARIVYAALAGPSAYTLRLAGATAVALAVAGAVALLRFGAVAVLG